MIKPRIVVFEDDESSRKLLTMVLEQKGYEVVSSSDPSICPLYSDPEASCPHEDACGDFLLTDHNMPNITGLEFIENQSRRGCKGVSRNKAIISAALSPEEQEKAEKLGCKIFRKPYSLVEISRWLSEREKLISPDRKLVSLDPPPEGDDPVVLGS